MTDLILTPELDMKPAMYRHGSKIFTQITQQSGGTAVTIPVSTTAESIFEIPIKAFYLSDSYIQGVLTPTAGGAGPPAFYNWFHKHTHFISEMYLMTRGGTYLVQLQNMDKYQVLTRGWNVPYDEFVTADDTDRFGPSRNTGKTADVGGRPTQTGLPASAPYTEIQYAERGSINSATPVIPFTIRLGKFHNTIMALRKAMLFPEVLILRVIWGPMNRFSWIGSDPTDATAGAADPAGVAAVSNLNLYMAMENDPTVISDLIALQQTNYQMAIPFLSLSRQPAPTIGTNLAVTVRVTPEMGFMLKQIVFGIFRASETLYQSCDHNNLLGVRLGSYNTMLDSVQRQQWIQSCGGTGGTVGVYDDWKAHQRLCKDTAIQSRDIYQYNWFHCDDFSDLSESRVQELKVPKENLVSGIPIQGAHGTERVWTISSGSGLSNAEQWNYYSFIVTYKTMTITPSAIIVTAKPPGV